MNRPHWSTWVSLVVALLCLMAMVVLGGRAYAAALDEPSYRLRICRPGAPCEERGEPVSKVTCMLEAAGDRVARDLPSATRIDCKVLR